MDIKNKLDKKYVLDNKFVINFMKLAIIILAAGKSSRFKSNIPKQFHFYNRDILINHSIKKFTEINEVKQIFVGLNKKYQKKYLPIIKKTKKVIFYNGGAYRSDSVKNGLNKIKNNFTHVLIHDSARADVSTKLIKKIIKELKRYDCVIPVVTSSDTTIYKKKYVDRNQIKLIQTPQGFNLKKIKKFHKNNKDKKITDDSILFNLNNEIIKIVKGEEKNKKITYVKDLGSKEKFFGIGYDIHKMSLGYSLYIGGIKIPSKFGAIGHSDGDSLLHALIDSFMGAAKLGDIGTIFPNNKKYKDIRSTKLVAEIIKKLRSINLKVSSIDLNIILQSPNLKPYKEKIKKNISKLCLIEPNKINIKAKTTDKLGIIGKNKALACEVISTLENV